jgi:type I restriction enzyme S subunit
LKPISDEIDQRFLQYAVASVISEAVESNRGAANPLITQKDLGNIKINLFSLPEQREIAGILGALDDKIELNRRIAATLEQMARSLYRSWFVDFDPVHAKAAGHPPAHMDKATAALFPDRFGDNGLPEGWRMGCLADVATNPRTCVKPEQIAPSTPYIGLEHMAKRSITLGDWVTAEDIGSQKSAMRQGDFLFGKLRPYFHKVGVSPVDGICSTDIVVVRAKSPEWEGFVLSVISSDEFVEHTNAGSSGTRMPRTNWGDMGRYQVILSPAPIAAAFEDMLGAFRRQIVAGVHENQTLATLRDSLLPRLMSGELRGNRSIATAANQAACS